MNTKCPDTEQQLVDTIEPPIDHPTAASRIVELWRRDYFAQPGILAALSVLFIVYISYHLLLLGPLSSTALAATVRLP